jgi:hypothetical protein
MVKPEKEAWWQEKRVLRHKMNVEQSVREFPGPAVSLAGKPAHVILKLQPEDLRLHAEVFLLQQTVGQGRSSWRGRAARPRA